MISQTAEYAFRAVVFLAAHPDEPMTAMQVAKGTGIPAGYLSKVLRLLAKAGLLRCQRGPKGGATLARSPAQMTLLDVVTAIEPLRQRDPPPQTVREHTLSPLDRRLEEVMQMVESVFATTTIDELLDTQRPMTPRGTASQNPPHDTA